MNRARRTYLKKSIGFLWEAQRFIENTIDSEQCSLDNIPENMESSDMYYSMEDNIDRLEDASAAIEDAICIVESISA